MPKDKDIARDFMHLSQAIHQGNDPISYELVVILENCIDDSDYKEDATVNIVSYAKTQKKIKDQLDNILKSKDEAYKDIQPVAAEFLKRINIATHSSSADGSKDFFFESSREYQKDSETVEILRKDFSNMCPSQTNLIFSRSK